MNPEYIVMLAMLAGGGLFALGGTWRKWPRRYILPLVMMGVALWGGFIWWKCLAMSVLMSAALHLPYGERTPYWLKFLVGCSYTATTAFLGFSWWQILTPLAFITMFWLSNWKVTSKIFFWKAVEFLTGTLIGITVGSFLLKG